MEIDQASITTPATRTVLPELPVEILKAISEYIMDGPLRLQAFANTDTNGYNLNRCFEYFHSNKRIGNGCEGRLFEQSHQAHRQLEFTGVQLTSLRRSCRQLDNKLRPFSSIATTRTIEVCYDPSGRTRCTHDDHGNEKRKIVPFPFQLAQFTTAIISVEYGVPFPELDAMLPQFPNLKKVVINSSVLSEFAIPHETYDRLSSNTAREKEICDFIEKEMFACRREPALAHNLKYSTMQLRANIRLRRDRHSDPEPPSWTATLCRQFDLIDDEAPGPSAACDVLIDLRNMRLLDKTRYDSVISQNELFLSLGYCPYMRFDMLVAILVETTKRWN